ncbi:hypothetical protein VTN77DRAFT_3132 [Rasamsonia byssochlamydoides]|uniref:uncharacterized protein n=1 Tax=Rasamsonia byssochlamydoides TaxID=89139 RepID=UPI003742EA93
MAKAKKSLTEGLQFERKNKDMLRLPKYARIHKRPIPHPPVASPYAGASVPKIVYVSTNTPFMSAAKRVQKLLRQAEKRATAAVTADSNNQKMTEKERLARLAKTQEKLEREKVYIKATGRAIEKALSIGRWFEQRGEEYAVQVKTGSVMVVDDIVEDEEAKRQELAKESQQQQQQQQQQPKQAPQSPDQDKTDVDNREEEEAGPSADSPAPDSSKTKESKNKRRRRRKKEKRLLGAGEELPESRTRWVNMVEIAVNLK